MRRGDRAYGLAGQVDWLISSSPDRPACWRQARLAGFAPTANGSGFILTGVLTPLDLLRMLLGP